MGLRAAKEEMRKNWTRGGLIAAAMVASMLVAAMVRAGATSGEQARRASGDAGKAAALGFAPLERWRQAVVTGNAAELAALYSVSPPAITVTAMKESDDPGEEPGFWEAAKAVGLETMRTEIVRVDEPQPGIERVIFRVIAMMKTPDGAGKRFATVAQYWEKEEGKWKIVATERSLLGTLPQPVLAKPNLYPDPREAKTDIAAALAAAKRQHMNVILDFGGNWCSDCHVLDAAFHYPEIARILEPNYLVVRINVGNYDENLDLAAKYDVPLKKGVPRLVVLNSKGEPLVVQKDMGFENTTKIGLKDVTDFLERWKPEGR